MIERGTVHVGGERKSVYEYALTVAKGRDIGELSVDDVSFSVPVDTSLDVSLMKQILGDTEWSET